MNNEHGGNPRHCSQNMAETNADRNKETKMPLPLFESVESTPFKGSLFLDTSLLVSAGSADSVKLLKRVDESPFQIISV